MQYFSFVYTGYKRILDDGTLGCLGWEMIFLSEMTPLEDTILDKVLDKWWIVAIIVVLIVVKVVTTFRK